MAEHKAELDSKRVLLFEERRQTSRFIHARIKDNVNLVVEGQDVGAMPLKWFDDEDYEFFATVRKEDKDQVLLALIQKVFSPGVEILVLQQEP